MLSVSRKLTTVDPQFIIFGPSPTAIAFALFITDFIHSSHIQMCMLMSCLPLSPQARCLLSQKPPTLTTNYKSATPQHSSFTLHRKNATLPVPWKKNNSINPDVYSSSLSHLRGATICIEIGPTCQLPEPRLSGWLVKFPQGGSNPKPNDLQVRFNLWWAISLDFLICTLAINLYLHGSAPTTTPWVGGVTLAEGVVGPTNAVP